MDGPSTRDRLRAALIEAMRARDATATAALRATIAAVDNAEAVPVVAPPRADSGRIAHAVSGLGAGEVDRVALSEEDVVAIVRSEVTDRETAAREYEALGQPDRAAGLRAQAAVLTAHLD